MDYTDKLKAAIKSSGSCLCVGLDPDLELIPDTIKETGISPEEQVLEFLSGIIGHTADHCAAYKPNLGFFEALGAGGLSVFEEVLKLIPDDKIVIADAKRGDIFSTARHYAQAYFERFDVDAITLNPLMGFETLAPFASFPAKAVYVLALTSNPGARDFLMKPFEDHPMMAGYIAGKLRELQKQSETHLGMVLGATKADHLEKVIPHHPDASLLIPGIGKQGGSTDELAKALKDHRGISLVNSSRSILYAGRGNSNWQDAVNEKAREFKHSLNSLTQRYV